MDLDDFWRLVDESGRQAATTAERDAWLTDRLAALPAADIAEFQVRLDQVRERVDTWHMWGAAHLICDGLCSDDGFWYFQCWLIGLGRETFERVAADPDALAGLPLVHDLVSRGPNGWADDEWPDWESLDFVAGAAYERVTGLPEGLEEATRAQGHRMRCVPEPADDEWDHTDRDQLYRRLPRLLALVRP